MMGENRSSDSRASGDRDGAPALSGPDLSARGPVPGQSPRLVSASEPVRLPTPHGEFSVRAWAFEDGSEHLTLTAPVGGPGEQETGKDAPLVRVHSECLTGDAFGSFRCGCGPQLHQGLEMIQAAGGTLVYLRGHEGRGIGLVNKLRAYALQDAGQDTVDANVSLGFAADARRYGAAAAMLRALGLERIRLVSNNPGKAEALRELGIEVLSLEPDRVPAGPENEHYLRTKRDRMRHLLGVIGTEDEVPLPPVPSPGNGRTLDTPETPSEGEAS